MNVFIVDDEPLIRIGMRDALERIADVRITGEFADGLSALEAILAGGVDAVFLDIQMGGLTGLEVVDTLPPEQRPAVVFVTAYDEFAIRAFEVNAVDYLLKPFDDARVELAVDRLRARLQSGTATNAIDRAIDQLRPAGKYAQRVLPVAAGRVHVIPVAEVDWFEGADNYVKIHAGERGGLLRETLARLESRLDPAHFARIHRSSIVNLQRIAELRPRTNGDYHAILRNGETLTVSRTYSNTVLLRLG